MKTPKDASNQQPTQPQSQDEKKKGKFTSPSHGHGKKVATETTKAICIFNLSVTTFVGVCWSEIT